MVATVKKQKSGKGREKTQAVGFENRQNLCRTFTRHVPDCDAYFRAGNQVVRFVYGEKHTYEKRVVTGGAAIKAQGLDVLIRKGGRSVQVQPDTRAPKQVKAWPKYDYIRTCAPSNGPPKVDEIKRFYKHWFLMTCVYHNMDETEPCIIMVAPMKPLIDLGYGEVGDKNKGYYFPLATGRMNTIHWRRKKVEWISAYVPGREEDATTVVSINDRGIVQPSVQKIELMSLKLLLNKMFSMVTKLKLDK